MRSFVRPLKWRVRNFGERFFPKLTLWVMAQRSWVHEPELALVPVLSSDHRLAVDIGANKGVYLYKMSRAFDKVVGFEPGVKLAHYLRNAAPNNAKVHALALSDHNGRATLFMPRGFNELATLERQSFDEVDRDAIVDAIEVDTRTLDTFGLDDVSLIKIDAEGHELPILQGAAETLERCKPALLIEIEERHSAGSVSRVTKFLSQFGYNGYFLDCESIRSMADFDLTTDQDISHLSDTVKVGRYINNFIFLHDSIAQQRVSGLNRMLHETAIYRSH